jgi:hypothetical protein
LLGAEWKGNMHEQERKANGFKMIDEGSVHEFAANDLLRYQKSIAERILAGRDNYTYGTSECFYLMGLGNWCRFSHFVHRRSNHST